MAHFLSATMGNVQQTAPTKLVVTRQMTEASRLEVFEGMEESERRKKKTEFRKGVGADRFSESVSMTYHSSYLWTIC